MRALGGAEEGGELGSQPRALALLSCRALTAVCPWLPLLGRGAAKKWLMNAMVSFNPLENIFPTCTE